MPPDVAIAATRARVTAASRTRLAVAVPDDCPGGTWPVTVDETTGPVTRRSRTHLATGVHQVDSPVVDRLGRVYATFSGSRGQQVPVSIFRLGPSGLREPFLVRGRQSHLDGDRARRRRSTCRRFEGTVSRVADDGSAALVVSNVGIACGLAFAPDGTLYVGDRSGTIFRAASRPARPRSSRTLPPSVAAFHLAFGPDGSLYVTAPTLSPTDPVRRVHPATGRVETVSKASAAVRRASRSMRAARCTSPTRSPVRAACYRIDAGIPRPVLAGTRLVGIAFGADEGLVVASGDTLYRFDPPLPLS